MLAMTDGCCDGKGGQDRRAVDVSQCMAASFRASGRWHPTGFDPTGRGGIAPMSRQPTIDNILPWAAHGYARENQPFRGLATHVVVANQLRRGLLPGAALLAGGATIIRAAHGTPSDLDAQLLRLYAAIMEQGAEIGGLLAYGRKLPRGPEKDAHDEHFDAADSAWFDLIEEIAQTPARTQAGLRAKAAALQLVGKADGPAERLALSLARDVLAV